MKIKEFIKANYRHIICIAITIIFAMCAFIFPYFLPRLIESCRDFGTSIAYWFCQLFEINHKISPSVINYSETPLTLPGFPNDYNSFALKWQEYWQLFVAKANVASYFKAITDVLVYLSEFIVAILPLYIVLKSVFKRYLANKNNDYNKDSKPLIAFKKFEWRVYLPVKNWLISFIEFIREYKAYWIIWLCLWGVYFNAASIVIEFFAFYFYFASEFDLLNIFVQVYKLMCDLSVAIEFIPGIIWLIAGYCVFFIIRKSIGYRILEHFQNRNRGFLKERLIAFMLCGSMGTKKTTLITSMVLTQEEMFRTDASDILFKYALKFPNFPWINLERAIKKAVEKHAIYNLATCKRFIESKRRNFINCPKQSKIFMYDYKHYNMTYNDDLKVIDIWDVLETYAKAYYVYTFDGAATMSNYSIRFDNEVIDFGNFPLRVNNSMRRNPKDMEVYSRRSRIIDYDSLRLGKLVVPDNVNANVFEFGTVVLTEIGKERGNYIENKSKEKKDNETNQKNDLFNAWLKLCRHSCTIDYKPFVRVIMDEQRPASLGADARELCEIVHIEDASKDKLAIPFFGLEDTLCSWLINLFSKMRDSYRIYRGDNTLIYYILNNLISKLNGWCERIKNRFGYCPVALEVEAGTQDGQRLKRKYYLMSKEIYSDRFSTACYEDFFNEKALKSVIGLGDMREYSDTVASFEELSLQNSYFFNDLTNLRKK